MLMNCPECENPFSDQAKACPKCAWPVPEAIEAEADIVPESPQDVWRKPVKVPWSKALVVGGAGLFLFFLFFHVVIIKGVPTPVRRVSVSLSEPFVDMAEITGMPWIAATSKFPLTVKALQQAGLVESDEVRQQRIEQEIRVKADAEYDRIMGEANEYSRKALRDLGY